jgi:AraC-like DNA-binding protein
MKQQTDIFADDILYTEDVEQAFSEHYKDYYLHIFVRRGSVSFWLNDRHYRATSNYGIILIEGKPVEGVHITANTKAYVLLISSRYLMQHMPKINYNIKGLTYYHYNPLMHMSHEDMERCRRDVDDIIDRWNQHSHLYYMETLIRAVDNFTYDLFDIYARCNGEQTAKGGQETIVTQQFITLLEKHVQQQRRVDYYAEQLFVTPKYLSRICQQATGHNASYWINRFALARISEALSTTNQSLTDISNAFSFPNLSHFTRFVKTHTGMTPTDFRIKKQKTN